MNTIPLLQHFTELKIRGSYILVALFASFIVCYSYSEQLLFLLVTPLGRNFIFTSMPEVFLTSIKLSAATSIIAILPIGISQIVLFLIPGLYKAEKAFVSKTALALIALFYIGIVSAYTTVVPTICKLFLAFEVLSTPLNIELAPKISEYYTLTTTIIFLTSQFFQLPVYLILIIKYKIIKLESLTNNKKAISAFILLAVAAVSPPDFAVQVILFFLLFLIYEVSIIGLHILKQYWNLEIK